MANRERAENQNPSVRPKQVLLVGLGGVGCRTVNEILSIMPEECKRYTHAVAVDTDLEELDKLLPNIPKENKIALGGNIDTSQSITIGDYIRKNPSTTEWFVEGKHLDVIERRNTSQGAKQVRMVSKVALAATNDSCGMQKTLNSIISEFNKTDGAALGRGLLVMVVCSIAGGTGAGTVLQFPLYLEQAVSEIFPDEDVQIECSMLLPGMFSRVQSTKNYAAAKTNAYAVIRELMSLNTGKIKRGDIIPRTELGEKADKISPYSRVLFFDSTSMAGDTLNGDLDTVYVPKVANALNEYLFGSVSGKITSALDNTLATVYESGGTAIFSSVGTAKLLYPRPIYTQYCVANWISDAISEDWLAMNRKAKEDYAAEKKKAIEQGTPPFEQKERTRELFCALIDKAETGAETDNALFYKELKAQLTQNASEADGEEGGFEDIVEEFWDKCDLYISDYINDHRDMKEGKNIVDAAVENKSDRNVIISLLENYRKTVIKATSIGYMHEKAVMCPTEAENGKLYADNKDTTTLYGFIKSKKLHPLMVKYFLIKLYEKARANKGESAVPEINAERMNTKGAAFRRNVDDELSKIKTAAEEVAISNFADYMMKDLDIYIEEYENMFDCLGIIINKFNEKKELCIKDLPQINDENGTVLAGGKLSMLYTWRKIKDSISAGEDVYTIDHDLDLKVHEIIYKAFVKQIQDLTNVKTLINGEKLKIRTKYESVLDRELLVYYTNKLNKNYSHMFPKNVIESALLECGLRNAYTTEERRVDRTTKFDFQTFIDRNPQPLNVSVSENGLASDADYLSSLLSATIGKGKPFCGRVERFADEEGDFDYTNRLLIINRSMLRSREDMKNIDDDGIPKTTYIEHEIIDGVSSSRIGQHNVNTKFVDNGTSPDEIISVTSISGLLPMNFVSFLPPDGSEHAPTKEHSYFSAYKDHLNNLTTKENFITPHLHRDWHFAGMLDDLTASHTEMYNDAAAKAFVYGFAFDLIKVVRNGTVEIGKLGSELFYSVFNRKYVEQFDFLSPVEHSMIESKRKNEKKMTDQMNEILVKIYNYLATTAPVRDAIIAYGDAECAKYILAKNHTFVEFALRNEEIDQVSYKSLIDVIGGYYRGTRSLSAYEIAAADTNTENMLTFLLRKTFEVSKAVSDNDDANLRKSYNFYVKAYYDCAVIDDGDNEQNSSGSETKGKANTTTKVKPVDLSAENLASEDISKYLAGVWEEMDNVGSGNEFAEGRFSRKEALKMLDVFLKDN